jgi:protein-tyrosine phosphatase
MSAGAVLIRKNRIRPPTLKVNTQVLEREKLSVTQLFQVCPRVYISGYEASKDLALLNSQEISHILNLAGEAKCPSAYTSYFNYYSLRMPDNPKVDILFFLYFAIEFIVSSLNASGKVLVHCVKGTSRAAAMALAYLMLQGYSEQDAYACLNAAHPAIDPNFGFVCQLKELKSNKQDPRVFNYSDKYRMFVNTDKNEGSTITIVGKSCTLYLDLHTPIDQQKLAMDSIKLWEKFNDSVASICYL